MTEYNYYIQGNCVQLLMHLLLLLFSGDPVSRLERCLHLSYTILSSLQESFNTLSYPEIISFINFQELGAF